MDLAQNQSGVITNTETVTFPANLLFKPNNNIVMLNVFNKNQFRRDGKGFPFYLGKERQVNIGDIVRVVSKNDNVNGKNYWVTESGYLIPKEAGLFQLTDKSPTFTDIAPIVTEESVILPQTDSEADKSKEMSKGKYNLIRFSHIVAGAGLLGFAGYKIAKKSKGSVIFPVLVTVLTGAIIGDILADQHFKDKTIV